MSQFIDAVKMGHSESRVERAIYEQDRDAALSEMQDIMREIFG